MADLMERFHKLMDEQGGLVGLKGVVKQFAEALTEAGVNIPPPPPGIPENSNARILKKGQEKVGVLVHAYTPSDDKGPPFWGISKSQVDRVRKECPRNWGVVCLRGQETFEFGFWVHGEHFDRLTERPYTDKKATSHIRSINTG
ncbi:MAG: hypothetical protein F4101_06500 [Nitrospira sp. SB0673_bin_12]|nr:hypothetical protein [Nitrospira sp. SB0673_bin_12]